MTRPIVANHVHTSQGPSQTATPKMAAIYARVNALDRKSSHPLTIGWSSCLKISKYRRRFARGVYANYDAMWEHVAIFGTPEHVAERLESL
jgi:alkanesulfonate monooxygenase SsuD/methylene tetrahydromethanopterin reductase-like flavin-dependent oxidoreductase (luciferase family)